MSVKSTPVIMGWCELPESALQSEPIYVQFTAFVYSSPWKSPVHLTTLNRTRGRMERRNLFELPLKFSLPNFPCCQEIIPPSSKQRCCNQVTWREGVIVTSVSRQVSLFHFISVCVSFSNVIVTSVSRQKIDKLFSILQSSC